MCTNAVQYAIRNNKLHAIVQMRSNDVVFGYRNDYAWQSYVLDLLCKDLNIERGDIHWNAGSLHVYERHFYLVHHWSLTGERHISKSDFDKLYSEISWGK
jgi:thymidylate synthase